MIAGDGLKARVGEPTMSRFNPAIDVQIKFRDKSSFNGFTE